MEDQISHFVKGLTQSCDMSTLTAVVLVLAQSRASIDKVERVELRLRWCPQRCREVREQFSSSLGQLLIPVAERLPVSFCPLRCGR